MRLYKYVKVFGNFTQSDVKKLYENNLIKVNDKKVSFSYLIKTGDIVTVNNQIIEKIPFKYFLYYKPKNIISDISSKDESYIYHINSSYKLMPVGRLDKDSSGLMILSNDGKYINKMNKDDIEKEYIVTLEKKVTEALLENITKPFYIKGKLTKEMKAYKIDDYHIRMILLDGRYHQIRRSVQRCDNKVIDLIRIRIGDLKIDNMKENELKEIKK